MKESTIRLLTRAKITMAVLILFIDIIGAVASMIEGFYPGVFLFLLLGGITFDYLRITRADLKPGLWYEIENVEEF